MDLRTILSSAAALLLAGTALADEIHTVDGRTISDIEILAERLSGIEYRDKERKTQTLPADDVLMVQFDSKPQLVDRADAAILEEAYPDAQFDLQSFVDGVKDRVPREHPWSRAYALYRLLEVSEVLGDLAQVSQAADQLRELEPESRYLPMAYLREARALHDSGDDAKAKAVLGELESLIAARSLGERWQLEHQLATLLLDGSLKGPALQAKLRDLSQRARGHAIVRSRADVALGESLVLGGKVPDAEKLFRDIVEEQKGDDRTMAAAYTGLGDCLYAAGEPRKDTDAGRTQLEEALLSYMRVVVSYKNQLAYVPKAMFYAGRCFQVIEDEGADEQARKLYLKLLRTYPDSRWSSEARGFLPKGK